MTIDLKNSTGVLPDQYTVRLVNKSFSVSSQKALLIIMVIAVLLRLLSAVYQGNTVTDLPGIYDQISYDGLARRVVAGHGFSFAEGHWPATRAGEPTAHWSYLYTLYLVVVYKLFGTYPLIARVIQAVIAGIFQTLLIWRIGTRLFNRTVGMIAALMNASYIYFFYYAGALITETFYITCILWSFDAAFRLVRTDWDPLKDFQMTSRFQWLELGLALGFTVLLRQVILLFLPFLFLWIWWNVPDRQINHYGWKNRLRERIHLTTIKGLSTVVLILALMIAPWTIRNYRAFGTFVLLNTNAGFAFYWGNHPIYGTHFVPILPANGPSYQDLIPPQLLPLNEGMLDKALLKEGIRIVLNDPIRYVLLSISRIEEYVKFWPSRDSSTISNLSRVGSFGIFLPFMLYGLLISFKNIRKPLYAGQGSDLLILYMFIIIYASIHILSWTLIRYRLPIDAFLILFAAAAFEDLVKRSQRWRKKTD